MGLDMYLYLKRYESQYKNDDCDYPIELGHLEEEISKRNFKSTEVAYQVGYWRKANAIHNWFVDNCGDGIDECQKIFVDLEKAKELLEICKKVQENHDLAEELLPTSSGFFFGSTEYDDWYFENIDYTVHLLEEVIKVVETEHRKRNYYDIIYQASW